MRTHTFIYKLIDPITNEVRYVGKADNLKSRYNHHLTDARRKPKCHRLCWIKGLLDKGLKPIMEVIEEVEFSKWQERERYWIKKFDNLTNMLDGGEDCPMYHKESVDKMTESKRGYKYSDKAKKSFSESRQKEWDNGIRSRECKQKDVKFKLNKKIKMISLWECRDKEKRDLIGSKISASKNQKVAKIDLKGRIIETFDSAKEAAIFYGHSDDYVASFCRGDRESKFNYKWVYLIDYAHDDKFVDLDSYKRVNLSVIYNKDKIRTKRIASNLIEILSEKGVKVNQMTEKEYWVDYLDIIRLTQKDFIENYKENDFLQFLKLKRFVKLKSDDCN